MKSISKQLIVISIILLLIGVSVSSAISVDTKSSIVDSEKFEDFGCSISKFNDDYPPIICSVLCAMTRVIGPIGDVIGILLIGLGYTKDEVENMLSPVINLYNSLLDMWSKLNCPSCYP